MKKRNKNTVIILNSITLATSKEQETFNNSEGIFRTTQGFF